MSGLPKLSFDRINHVFLEAGNCQRCYPGQEIHVPLPDPSNSGGPADIMFINERPGRTGTGESSHVSYENDDPSAKFFRELFESTGIERKQIFITNACLCHPDFESYRDKQPRVSEMANCHHWLREQMKIVRPRLIVTVGWVALQSLLRYQGLWSRSTSKNFSDWVGQLIDITDPWIYPVAHTSLKGRINRNSELQREDWADIPKILERFYGEWHGQIRY